MPKFVSGSRTLSIALVLGALSAGAMSAWAEPLFVQDAPDASSGEAVAAASWDALAVSSLKSSITSESRALRVFLAEGDRASFSRTAEFSPQPSALVCRFNLAISEAHSKAIGAQVFRLGSRFSPSNGDESDASTYARLGVNTLGTGDAFQLRDLVAHTNSSSFRGTQAITWVLNHSGGTRSYSAPNGTVETVDNDHMDVWVGRERVFNESAITTSTAAITNLKWYWGAGSGVATFDRFEIDALEEATAGRGEGPVAAPAAALGSIPASSDEVPAIELYRPTPNPFTANMRFAYAVPMSQHVTIGIFDLAGRRVRDLVNGEQTAGQYQAVWDGLSDDGSHVTQGIYFLRAAIGSDRRVSRLVYLAH